jgi:hypothetical protein
MVIQWKKSILTYSLAFMAISQAHAGPPVFSIVPIGGSNAYPAVQGDVVAVSYTVTNNTATSKIVSIKNIAGATQVTRGTGVCGATTTLAAAGNSGSSCTLKLKINTSQMAVGTAITDGPFVCIGSSSRLTCSRPSQANLLQITVIRPPDALLTASSSDVVAKVGGSTRTITITNNGSAIAQGINTQTPTTVPAPWGNSVTSAPCANLNPGDTCTITFTANGANYPVGTAPTPGSIIVKGSNTNQLVIDYSQVEVGNIYQGGYIYNINDATASTANIGGYIAALSDQPAVISTSVIYPNYLSLTDGYANTQAIKSIPGQAIDNYAAYNCTQKSVDETGQTCMPDQSCYSNWYLPAICEMENFNAPSGEADCRSSPSGMMNQLYYANNNVGGFTAPGNYWSSSGGAFGMTFYLNTAPGNAFTYGGGWTFPSRCARAIT